MIIDVYKRQILYLLIKLNAKFLLYIISSIPLASNNTTPFLFIAINFFSISIIFLSLISSKKINNVFIFLNSSLYLSLSLIHLSGVPITVTGSCLALFSLFTVNKQISALIPLLLLLLGSYLMVSKLKLKKF